MAEDYKDRNALFLACQPLLEDGWTLADITRALGITYQNFHHAYRGTPGRRYSRERELELARAIVRLHTSGARPVRRVSQRPQLLEAQKALLKGLQAEGPLSSAFCASRSCGR